MEDRIRERAYQLWEEAGRPDGAHDQHWEEARRQIEAESVTGAAGSDGPAEGAGLGEDLIPTSAPGFTR
ncbi:MAG TPA: DUF2934 domain-containing protein [Alphaproteobacteria bacterium]|nr:DUF2934 domain-containing protein [Alphaproteobacteria bacterium]